ncbi:DNRLRE domain-containing protein [Streptomyces sp. NBC_00233]|uniref:golvesin C-terminal-like domain-containing protein n=1 Tax=Streptomyces sp. NBC_00233 TaxID=2975686 RepID=UPI00224D0853|nr:DNRLRE domain-containing protein [Streptomyces sp. NBC_00233]MCX5232014.1 DNRLRE domain-containing protein [Streptomyces sp. NBC_00233]
MLPQVAYAAPVSSGDGEGIVDAFAGWFSDDEPERPEEPSTGGTPVLPSRERLPKGKAAAKPKRVAELTGRRTATARYWQLSDGRVQAEVSAVPTGYRAGKSWKDIDPTVTPTEAEGFAFTNATNTARSWFGTDASSLLRFEAGGRAVTLGLEDAGRLAPVAEGDTVTYKDAVHGADLSYEVGPGRVKENILLDRKPTGPVSFTFTLDAGGLTPKAGKDGSVLFYGEGADPVLVIPAAFMTDARKDTRSPYGFAYSDKVTQKLSRAGKGWKLTVTPDADWLAAPERQYPVTVDPTISIAPTPTTAQDVMISSDGPATNYNDNWRLSVGNTTTGTSRALLRFPLTGVPAGTKLDSADLKLYYDQTHTTGDTEVQLEAHRATQAWTEEQATWNSANALTGELSGTAVVVDDGDTGRTAAVGAWPASGNTAYTQYAVNQDYLYNKDSVTGDTYTWQPNLPEDGVYQVEAHNIPASDRATNAPYTITYDGGSKAYTVDQQAGTAGVWKTLGSHPFKAGTLGKIVLGDGPASTATSVIADAVRFTKGGVVTKRPGELNTWHTFPVTKTVQSWIDGANANNGFVVKAGDESANGPKGGPRYEGSEFGYGGETANYPRLVMTFGRQGVDLAAPSTIHDTGAELSWSAYQDKDPIGTGDDIVEYQVHRSINQTFTPSPATLVAPVASTVTSFTDTTGVPTKADDPDPFGRAYYYMVAVRTKDGQVVAAPTQLVRLPKAGRTTKVLDATQDTTLSSARPTLTHDTIDDSGPKNWLSVGNNSATYGDTRALLKFPALGIPATARVLDANVRLWSTQTAQDTAGAVYELRPLTRDFDEATATWVKANATTNWTTAGGDLGAVVADTGAKTNDPARHDWNVTSLAQSWVTTPASQQGVAVRMADEAAAQERTLFLSSEGTEQRLRPRIVVTYVDSTTESTYYAPQTPARMTPNTDHTVDFTLTNTTASTWNAADQVLTYRWALPDGTDVTNGGNQVQTALPSNVAPGGSVGLQATVRTPINSDNGNKRTDYVLTWDVYNKTTGTWASGTAGIPGLKQNVAVEDPTSNQLGMEKFYSYTGKNTGAGSTVMNNTASGNTVWQYNAFTNPGRGVTTFARFAYNSLDTSDTVSGPGWSFQAAGPVRLGAPLEFHPKPHPTEIRLPDGDGTTHVFREQSDGSWKAPAGVHYKLMAKPGLDCTPLKDPVPDAWTMTRPDGTRFVFGCDGYMTSLVEKNGNTQTYTYEERKSNNKPTKFLKYITDPAGRQSLTLEYYSKADGNDPKIIDHIKSMTDISGRKVTFEYSDKGLLTRITDGAGSTQPKVFGFDYDATQGNKNVKLVKATDPRGNATSLVYNFPQTGDDPKYHWWTKTITDRLQGSTGFVYAANAGNPKFTDTKVTDAESRATDYVTDDFGRAVQSTNAKSQTMKLAWDADNNVTYSEENNGAKTAYCYDQKTGHPLWKRDAENNKAGVPPSSDCAPGVYPANTTRYVYQTRADGYSADLFTKTSPEGRKWQFGYDTFGNLKTVTDPKGVATTTVAGDYTTTYEYDAYGQLTRATDANGNADTNSDFGPTGFPRTMTDALNKSSTFVYDERGQVTEVTDALGKKITQTYDTFGRPLVKTEPKDQAAGDLITAPAPVYDANDNVTTSTAPNGAVSTAVYDATDQMTSATEPKYTGTSDERRTTYTYDKVGNLRTTTEPKGTLTTADATDFVTTNHYNEIYQLTSVTNANGDKVAYEYDNAGNTTKVIDPKKNATADTADYSTLSAYDLNHRVTAVTDAAGKTTRKAYDKDSLVVSTTDAENNTTLVGYDERGKQTEVRIPRSGTSPITYRTTRYEYDQVGNTTKVITPRAVEAGTTTAFTARTEYDALNRPKRRYQPYDPADARHNDPNVYTETVYDAVGRVAKTSMPPSEGQTVRNDAAFQYFDNGWTKSSTDPWDIATTYDYNDVGQQTTRTLTSAGGSSNRTMTWSFYPDGKVRSRSDDGVPVGKAVVLADNSDTQHTAATGTWATGNITGQQGYDHRTHAAGAGTDAFTWTLDVPEDGTYTAYVRYPKVTGAATTAKYTLSHGTTTEPAVTKDQNAGSGTWVALGSYALEQGEDTRLKLEQNSAGVVVADGIKLVRDNSAETDTEKRTFDYTYDVNGNLTAIGDTSSGAKIDGYAITYTGLNQVRKVTESLAGVEKKATSYTYDANGQSETVTHPSQFSRYTYDLREKVKTVSVGKSATDTDPKVTSYTYTDRSQKLRETKANGNTVDYTYYLDGALKSTTEKKADGTTLVASHTYAYDANGNKAQDAAKKMNADNRSAYLDSTTDFTYDPADRLTKSVKTGNGAGTETYTHDDNANVISQTVKGVGTTFQYDRNRLLTSTTAGVGAQYAYDPFGRQQSVSSGGKVVERTVYDGFDHVVESQKAGAAGAMTSTTYTFDPLDRTASKTSDGKTTEFEYLGLSGEVLDEKVAGALTKSFQYSPWGERLSQTKHNTDGTTEDGYYGYNSHTDVETLTDKNGDAKATYGYTAYGNNDATEFTGIDKPEAGRPDKEEYNPYRFNAKRWDAQSGTYDMGFRDYNPGLNRFTSRDMYNGALADMKLGADPYTSNRYAFTGGNPTSLVELDGHFVFAIPAIYWAGAALVTALYAATPEGQQNLADAGAALGSMLMPSADDTTSSDSSDEPRPGPTPNPSPGPAPRPAPRTTDTNNPSCDPTPLIDGGRIYGGLEEYTDHQGNKGCRATGAFAFLTKADRRSRTGAGGLPRCPECEPSVQPDGMGEIAAGGGEPQAGHLIGYWGKGTGQDVKNLVALHGSANRRMASKVERFGWKHLTGDNKLIMSVVPVYGDPHSAVPTLVQVGMTAYGPQGDIVDTFSCTAINSQSGVGSTC